MAKAFFETETIPFVEPGATKPRTPTPQFRHYRPDELVEGKPMRDHLRFAVCYWHSFNWPGSDVFGAGTFDDTAFVLVADHGMQETDPSVRGDWDVDLRAAGIGFRDEGYGFLYLDEQ